MSGRNIAIAAAALVVAFAAAFGVGKATAGGSDEEKSAPSPVKSFQPDEAETKLAGVQAVGRSACAPPREEKEAQAARERRWRWRWLRRRWRIDAAAG